jgi:hypothetical protein
MNAAGSSPLVADGAAASVAGPVPDEMGSDPPTAEPGSADTPGAAVAGADAVGAGGTGDAGVCAADVATGGGGAAAVGPDAGWLAGGAVADGAGAEELAAAAGDGVDAGAVVAVGEGESGADVRGVPRGGSNPSGSTYPSSWDATRTPMWTLGTACSGSPLEPIVATEEPSSTASPLPTPMDPRWTRVTA